MSQNIDSLEALIQSLEQRVKSNEEQLRLAHGHCPACGNRKLRTRTIKEVPFSALPLTDAAMTCLLEIDYPISPRILRHKLKEKGYPESKLGRYGNRLHTAIWRLSEGQNPRIKRLEGDEIVAI